MNSANSPDLCGRHFQNEMVFQPSNLLFQCHDLNETCLQVGQIFKPHRLKIIQQKSDFFASMHMVRTVGSIQLSRLEYSEDVYIDPDDLEQFYLIQIPTKGYAEIQYATHKFISYDQVASLLSPGQSLQMRWHAGSPQLIVKIAKEDFLFHCRQHLPHFQQNSLVFDPKLDFSRPSAAYFLQLLKTLMTALATEQHPLQHPLAFKQFESSLFNALIYGQANNSQEHFQQEHKIISPYFIKRTEAYIRENLHEPLNIELLAAQAGISVRTLFNGFKNYLGTTPMAYLKELRFEQAHLELINNEHLSITDVAFKWGFTHLGRFSQEYKRRYGRLPSTIHKQKIV
ncbi:AraC family transcriptional regulator [Acinetobacter rudis]|uniref:AraC family transcriptional regulator n=1 Tax=Acinetobacter rudis TaxID=632955 RepID=UPI00333E3C8F